MYRGEWTQPPFCEATEATEARSAAVEEYHGNVAYGSAQLILSLSTIILKTGF